MTHKVIATIVVFQVTSMLTRCNWLPRVLNIRTRLRAASRSQTRNLRHSMGSLLSAADLKELARVHWTIMGLQIRS